MKRLALALLPMLASAQPPDSVQVRRIYDYYLTKSSAYDNLRELTSNVGGRLSGSPQAAKAVEWARNAMYRAGADTVFLQPCMVPHWDRGAPEKCLLISKKTRQTKQLRCTALGSSVGTGIAGVSGPVVEVRSFEELQQLGERGVRGKVVFYNVFFDQRKIKPGNAYSDAVRYRSLGASHAARYGAVACVVRSMTSLADDEPHTGNMHYDTTVSKRKIPSLALGYLSADVLHDALAEDANMQIYIETHCRNLPEVESYNVVGQLNGTESKQIIMAGGHLDSWDLAQGAHDDGAGVVQTIELFSLYKRTNIVPYHTIRVVAFMNEENGLRGGAAYAANARRQNENHIAAIESDAGGFSPRGFGVDTTRNLLQRVSAWHSLLRPYLVEWITADGGGADISFLEKDGVPCIGFEPDSQRYFDIHHTAQDTFDKVNARELNLGAAAIGSLVYLLDRHTR